MKISGAPVDGGSFSVQPGTSANPDVFATLKQPVTGSSAAQTNLTNALATAGTQISNSHNNVLTMQTMVGEREQ